MKEHKTLIRFSMRKPYEKSSRNKCDVCGNEFKSEKALCGHMRCHPKRLWRGLMQPRAASPAAAAAGGADDGVFDPPPVEDCNNNRPLLRWSVTDKRGRKCIKKRKMVESCDYRKTEDQEPQIDDQQLVTYSDQRGSKRMLDFDLNQLPQVDDDGN